MNTRLNFPAPRFWILGLALLLRAAPVPAAPIRVTTWDLQPRAEAGTKGWSNKFQQSLIQEAAQSLKQLHPDVIILQQVADWQTCHQLAQALQPENYQVAICSSFRDPHTKLPGRQVAILSKARAYLSWSGPWQNSGESPSAPGGFAFAAIKLDGKNVGVFSVQFSDDAASAREESARQLVQQIASVQNWKANRVQAFIVAKDFNTTPDDLRFAHEKTLSYLEQIGFENAFAVLPLEKRPKLDYIFTRDAGLVAAPLIIQSGLSEHDAATCEVDLALPKAIAALPPPLVAPVKAAPADNPVIPLWFAVFPAVCLVLFILARKHAVRSELQLASATLPNLKAKTGASRGNLGAGQIVVTPPSESPPYVQIEVEGSTQTQSQTWRPRPEAGRATARMPEAVRAGVIANLSQWLKQKVVQRLVSDRAQLLATQQAAALKVLAVDERLAKVEHQIQQRNRDYERRIDDLLRALITAKEENRELIRAQIALLKAEMEKAGRKAGRYNDEQY